MPEITKAITSKVPVCSANVPSARYPWIIAETKSRPLNGLCSFSKTF